MKRYLLLGNSLWLLSASVGWSQTKIEPWVIESQLPAQLVSQVNIPTANPEPEAEAELEITVLGTRTRRAIKDSPSTISVQDRQDLDRNFVRNLGDTVRYEPGVSVDNRPVRAGNGSVNIRGIEGNRVLMLIDGIRLPDILVPPEPLSSDERRLILFVKEFSAVMSNSKPTSVVRIFVRNSCMEWMSTSQIQLDLETTPNLTSPQVPKLKLSAEKPFPIELSHQPRRRGWGFIFKMKSSLEMVN